MIEKLAKDFFDIDLLFIIVAKHKHNILKGKALPMQLKIYVKTVAIYLTPTTTTTSLSRRVKQHLPTLFNLSE